MSKIKTTQDLFHFPFYHNKINMNIHHYSYLIFYFIFSLFYICCRADNITPPEFQILNVVHKNNVPSIGQDSLSKVISSSSSSSSSDVDMDIDSKKTTNDLRRLALRVMCDAEGMKCI